MTISIRFVIDLEPAHYDAIVSKLTLAGFDKIVSTGVFPENTPIRSELQCVRDFLDWHEVFVQQNYINNITGVRKINILSHQVTQDKQKWYKHWVFPMLIGTAVTIISLLILVYSLRPDTTLVDYVIISIVPPILSFASAVGVKISS